MNSAERDSRGDSPARMATPEGVGNKFTLRLADGRWVSSPTNTVTDNPNLAGVFTAANDESATELRGAMERLHGPLVVVPWQSKRAVVENVALMDEAQDPFAGAEVIYAYTRKQALGDGVQIDVSEVACEAGLKFPVYLTRAVWENYVRVPEDVRCQDESGRLWDIVWMLRCAARRTSGPHMLFRLHVRNDNRDRTPPLVTLKAVCGPRDIDDPQPAITVMLPDED
jgi:hypothetical protein